MLPFLTTLALFCLVVGMFFLLFLQRRKKQLGLLTTPLLYSDTAKSPGEVLHSQTLRLKGKPDYLVREGKAIIPIEVKTGRTPQKPYLSHTLQLAAYCHLVEENFGITPPYGILHYPEKQFTIPYSEELKKTLYTVIEEIHEAKQRNEEYTCSHPYHN